MKKFLIVSLADKDGETALFEFRNDNTLECIVKGDYYHNKIESRIDGFLEGLGYANIEYSTRRSHPTVSDDVYMIDELEISIMGDEIVITEKEF